MRKFVNLSSLPFLTMGGLRDNIETSTLYDVVECARVAESSKQQRVYCVSPCLKLLQSGDGGNSPALSLPTERTMSLKVYPIGVLLRP